MKQKLYKYEIYLFGKDEPFNLVSQEQGQKIIMAIASPNPPKFVIMENDLIAVSSISRVETSIPFMWDEKNYRELTESEQEINKKFLEFKGKGKLLLN